MARTKKTTTQKIIEKVEKTIDPDYLKLMESLLPIETEITIKDTQFTDKPIKLKMKVCNLKIQDKHYVGLLIEK